jgi:hypothetical protein
LWPEAADGIRAEGFFSFTADFRSNAFLDHIKKLEADGVKFWEGFGKGCVGTERAA